MNFNRFILIVLLICPIFLIAEEPYEPYKSESFNFAIKYLGITVADVTLNYDPPNDASLGTITVNATSTKLGGVFFKINNRYESVFNENFTSITYKKQIEQKNIQFQREVQFDIINLTASILDSDNSSASINIEAPCRDLFSTLLYLRLYSKQKESDSLSVFANFNLWKANYSYIRNEIIDGKQANMYEITFHKISNNKTKRSDILTNNIVKKENTLCLWFTDDDNRLPIQAEYKMSPFSVIWHLENYSSENE